MSLDNQVVTPGVPGQAGDVDTSPEEQFQYRKGTGKLLHLQKWSRPDILNATWDLSRFMGNPTTTHVKALHRIMTDVVQTPARGLLPSPDDDWDGTAKKELTILGRCDASFHSCPDTGRSVSGWSIFVHGASTENKSSIQNWVALSTTEAELVSATSCAQFLLFHYRLLTDIGLCVKMPMVLGIDNKGAKHFICNWSAGGRIWYVNIRQYFLRDLKEENMVKVIWKPTLENSTDAFTKNLYGPLFEKHIRTYVGLDVFYVKWQCWW
jgi:hypothetical protein